MRALSHAGVTFVVIGGVALQIQGSAYTTYDLDIAYERTRENAMRMADALRPFTPRPRGWDSELPFVFDAQVLLTSEILTLETSAGDLDLLAAVKGLGSSPISNPWPKPGSFRTSTCEFYRSTD